MKNKRTVACKALIKDFYHKNRLNYFLAIVSQILTAILNVSIAFLILITIDSMEKNDIKGVLREGIFLGLILVLYVVSSLLSRKFKNQFMMNGLARFKTNIFSTILKKSIGEYEYATSGGIMSALYNDLGSIEVNYLSGNLQLVHQICLLALAVASMYYLNPILASIVIATSIIPLIVSSALGKRLVKREKITSDKSEGFASQVKDILNGFITIKSFKAENEILEVFNKQSFTLEEVKKERRNTNDTIVIAGEISAIMMISIIFVVGQFMVFKGIMTIGPVIAFVQLSNYVIEPIQKIVPLWSNRKAALGLLEKISSFSEKSADIDDKNKIIMNKFERNITIRDLSYSYEPDHKVLNGINLIFEKGKSYAIVGASGCGKTTLLQLLLGYYDDYDGEILYDDNSLHDISFESLYDLVSVMQQNVFLFNSTIENNITMFKEFDAKKIKKATELAGVNQLITEKGYDYDCGVGGDNLSGGEKQRISIARCLLRETPIIILDEATAALDNIKAKEIENLILGMEGFTRIVVTHKLDEDVLKQYDRIFVLKGGEVYEQGTFDELIGNKEYFYSLYSVTKDET